MIIDLSEKQQELAKKWLPFLAVLLVGALPRLLNLADQGLHGDGDNAKYYKIAFQWLNGDRELVIHFRPVSFFLNWLAMKTFGVADYAIKYFNAFFGLLTVALSYSAALMSTRSRVLAFFAGLAIAVSPVFIEHSRIELLHIQSALFVLATINLLLLWYSVTNSGAKGVTSALILVAAGVCLGLTTLTHEELAFLGPASVAFILIATLHHGASFKVGVVRSIAFTAMYFVPVVAAILYFDVTDIIAFFNRSISNNIINETVSRSLAWKLAHYPLDMVAYTLTSLFFWVYLCASGYWLFETVRAVKEKRTPHDVVMSLCIIAPLFYMLFSCLFFSRLTARLFIPFAPLVLIADFWFLNALAKRWIVEKRAVVTAAVFFVMTVVITLPYGHNILLPNQMGNETLTYQTTLYKNCREALNDEVDYKNRLLVVPYTLYNQNDFWNFYFGPRLVDRVGQYGTLRFEEILEQADIRYVAIAKSMLGRWSDTGIPHGKAYGIPEEDYTESGEVEYVLSYMKEHDAEKVFSDHTVEIWELRDKRLGGSVFESYGLFDK